MPRTALEDCPKESFDWEKRTPLSAGHKSAWVYTGSAQARKNDCAEWSHRVRAEYEVPRRLLRVYRWCKRSRFGTSRIERTFKEEASRWKTETQHWSSLTKMVAHPSYLRIIGLANQATHRKLVRLLLLELKNEPDHWFDALTAITGVNPVQPEDEFDEAVDAWLTWGREKGLI